MRSKEQSQGWWYWTEEWYLRGLSAWQCGGVQAQKEILAFRFSLTHPLKAY